MKLNFKAWFHKVFDNFLKFNKMFQIGAVITATALSINARVQSNKIQSQSNQIESLTVSNAYLLSESMSDSKAVNESPFVWWKKEIDPDTEVIIMRDYNDAFYEFFLISLGVDRFYYVRKTDFAVFPHDEAQIFYDEDLALYNEFMRQPLNENGSRNILIKSYNNHFTNLDGSINKSGYWRYVREEEGHIYIYGMMKEPFTDYLIE